MHRRVIIASTRASVREVFEPLILEVNVNNILGYDFVIPIGLPILGTYDYEVNWDLDNSSSQWQRYVDIDAAHTYPTANTTYKVGVRGIMPNISFHQEPTRNKVTRILNWGDIKWVSLDSSFRGIEDLVIDAIDSPDFSQCNTARETFYDCLGLTGSINHWDLGSLTSMRGFFQNTGYNDDLSGLDVSNILSMNNMFWGVEGINQNFTTWNFNINVNLVYFARCQGMSIPNMNLFLDHLANIMVGQPRTEGKRIDLQGAQRTGSSDASYDALVADGWTINGVSKV